MADWTSELAILGAKLDRKKVIKNSSELTWTPRVWGGWANLESSPRTMGNNGNPHHGKPAGQSWVEVQSPPGLAQPYGRSPPHPLPTREAWFTLCPVSSNPSSKEALRSDTCMKVCALHLRHWRGCPPGQRARAPRAIRWWVERILPLGAQAVDPTPGKDATGPLLPVLWSVGSITEEHLF